MKKIIRVSMIFLALSIAYLPKAFCQDTTSEKTETEETDDQNSTANKDMHQEMRPIVFGVEAGLNMTDFLYSHNDGGVTSTPLTRLRAGLLADIPVHGVFYIQPGIFYAMNGADGSNATWKVNTIEVPVNAIFKFMTPDGNDIFVGAGPFVGYNINGKSSGGNFEVGSATSDNLKTWDYGIGANGGYEFKCGLFFRARYQWGFANLQPQTSSYISTINSESYGIQVGYFLGRKPARKPHQLNEPVIPKEWDE